MRVAMRVPGLLPLMLVLAGCGLLPIVEPIGEPMPPDPGMPQPIGPTIEIGSGRTLGIDWSYSVYRSNVGWCTQIDQGGLGGGSACGGMLEVVGDLSLSGAGSGTGSPHYLEGLASDAVAEVWVEDADGDRFPASLMSLAPAGLDGQVFVAWLPVDREYDSIIALGADGEELDTEPIDLALP